MPRKVPERLLDRVSAHHRTEPRTQTADTTPSSGKGVEGEPELLKRVSAPRPAHFSRSLQGSEQLPQSTDRGALGKWTGHARHLRPPAPSPTHPSAPPICTAGTSAFRGLHGESNNENEQKHLSLA